MPGEYKGDFTRDTFHRSKHFLRVLTQQGRVSIEADWNEQTSILVHHQRTLARDIFGEHGASAASPRGFEISALGTASGPAQDFRIGGGRYYVQGLLCEVEAPSMPVIGPAQNLPAGQHGVALPALTLDGRPFEKLQFVEVYEVAKPANSTVAQIIDQPAKGTLILDRALGLSATATLRVRRVTTYLTQPDYQFTNPTLEQAPPGRQNVVYLDVWERHITHVQDDAIREVALGTADTATRSKIVWQVKIADLDAGLDVKKNYGGFLRELHEKLDHDHPAGMLKVRATPDVQSTDPCTMSPDARYRGVENQLYRVEVHRGGRADPNDPKKCATFKWSRENGSVVFPIISGGGTRTLKLEYVGRDDRSSLREGDLVEARDDTSALHNRVAHLLRVESIDRVSMVVTLSEHAQVAQHPGTHPILIRWDHASDSTLRPGSDHAAMIIEGSGNRHWLALEDGIEIQFQETLPKRRPAHYRTGDYWLIPARTATGDVEWPVELDNEGKPLVIGGAHVPLALRPHGIEHQYAPLAVITVAQGGVTNPVDCRRRFDIAWI
jgi:hypothetical protein